MMGSGASQGSQGSDITTGLSDPMSSIAHSLLRMGGLVNQPRPSSAQGGGPRTSQIGI